MGPRGKLVPAPLPDLDHACETGEGFVDVPGERERRDRVHELEPVGGFDQLARHRFAGQLC